ncbi:hypothetical protein A3A76_03595 [Candidatus Woesebacteria bacterium RIFCSPLOWO2_01_FULL_39_23]|nr:MAG: hypothetical protein A2141_00430 [Candidatus Woesebacteria bacterium RBG_16_40_11]OGM36131.1 MAG: hypothetical protein A3E41_02235 [Candidatus Woesebacteria bacterium RIFCSPHIGHO2_12_FULL_38_9]OGM62713.1 MAG: hypothetical protein A3A76_03595 [Candidatus Woesebacteria bacterium RIFCSPLOWO2_01_FULL_39_23]
MRKIIFFGYLLVSVIFLLYLSYPQPDFPSPPPDALQSKEPGDSETPLRRAYFTNYTRSEVMDYYSGEFKLPGYFGLNLLSYRLNYPPEDAQSIIRDQTRSTFLEEIVHPFRESVFINGFEPKDSKDAIFIEGRVWSQKITVRYIRSSVFVRIVFGLLTVALIFILTKEIIKTIISFQKYGKN